MRNLIALLPLLVACGSDDAATAPDAAPVDALPPYSLTWTCQHVCGTPDLVSTTTLAINGLTLTYGGGPGGAVHVADEIDASGCYVVPALPVLNGTILTYKLCPVGTGLETRIQWTTTASNDRPLWRLQAWR